MEDLKYTKYVRPFVMAFLTIALFILIVLDSWFSSFTTSKHWVELISSLMTLVYMFYFGGRTLEKVIDKVTPHISKKLNNDR
jgi:predicted branched-subunit amino acid permease